MKEKYKKLKIENKKIMKVIKEETKACEMQKNIIDVLKQAINSDICKNNNLKEINEWWNNLQNNFKQLNQNYQDYHREFYTGKSEKLLKSVEFITHKDKFISYLHDFIR